MEFVTFFCAVLFCFPIFVQTFFVAIFILLWLAVFHSNSFFFVNLSDSIDVSSVTVQSNLLKLLKLLPHRQHQPVLVSHIPSHHVKLFNMHNALNNINSHQTNFSFIFICWINVLMCYCTSLQFALCWRLYTPSVGVIPVISGCLLLAHYSMTSTTTTNRPEGVVNSKTRQIIGDLHCAVAGWMNSPQQGNVANCYCSGIDEPWRNMFTLPHLSNLMSNVTLMTVEVWIF